MLIALVVLSIVLILTGLFFCQVVVALRQDLVDAHDRAIAQQVLHSTTVSALKSMNKQLEADIESTKAALAEEKQRHGLLRSQIRANLNKLEGHGFKSKDGPLERSAPFKGLRKVQETAKSADSASEDRSCVD